MKAQRGWLTFFVLAIAVIITASSNSFAQSNLRPVPTLVTAMGGHYFIRDNEIHYELSGAKDKDYVVVEGAEHGQTPCVPCETTPGQYANSVKNFYDYVRDWIDNRF